LYLDFYILGEGKINMNDFVYLKDMYNDNYYPTFLVDKIRDEINKVVDYLSENSEDTDVIQKRFDRMTDRINDLQDVFHKNGSELETVARDSITTTVIDVLEFYDVDIDVEEALRNRDW